MYWNSEKTERGDESAHQTVGHRERVLRHNFFALLFSLKALGNKTQSYCGNNPHLAAAHQGTRLLEYAIDDLVGCSLLAQSKCAVHASKHTAKHSKQTTQDAIQEA